VIPAAHRRLAALLGPAPAGVDGRAWRARHLAAAAAHERLGRQRSEFRDFARALGVSPAELDRALREAETAYEFTHADA